MRIRLARRKPGTVVCEGFVASQLTRHCRRCDHHRDAHTALIRDDWRDPSKETEVVNAVESLLDVSLERHSDGEETFIACHLCGSWEGHEDECPVPALLRWLGRK